MIIAFSLFIALSLFLTTMLLFRVWEIRVGRIAVSEEKIPEKIFSIDETEEKLEDFFGKVNAFLYHAGTLSFSHLAVFLRQVGESARSEWKKFRTRLPAHLPNRAEGSSFFLKDISAHKEEVRRENGYHGG